MSERCASWSRLIRTISWLTRFKYFLLIKCGRTDARLDMGLLKLQNSQRTRTDILSLFQETSFPSHNVGSNRRFDSIKRLKPYESDGLICMRGRVQRKGTDQHIPILPRKGRITELIIRHFHESQAHVGATQVLAAIRRQYWIVKGMAAVRQVLSKCARCRLLYAPVCQQEIAPLPKCRTECGKFPFEDCGLDYFGPFKVKQGRSILKRYGCLFTCLRTRAVHIEVAHDLSTDSFLMVPTRFACRRGPPKSILSDNGSNFIGADLELKCALDRLNQEQITDKLRLSGIEWNFNPPHASHRGGVWERIIRTIRRLLTSLVREQTLTDEVLHTVLTNIEYIINDRPIIPVYDDPDQPIALRPNDLLLLRAGEGLPIGDCSLREYYTKRWRQAHHLSNVFWKRWLKEYVPTLQAASKWFLPHRNLKEGDLVLIHKADTPRGLWPKGVVTKVCVGSDKLVRTVFVRTTSGELKRDIRSLCLLEGADN